MIIDINVNWRTIKSMDNPCGEIDLRTGKLVVNKIPCDELIQWLEAKNVNYAFVTGDKIYIADKKQAMEFKLIWG